MEDDDALPNDTPAFAPFILIAISTIKITIIDFISVYSFTITINNVGPCPSLRLHFEDNYFYEFGLLDKFVDWRNLDARDWNRQQTVVDLVDAWAKNVFNDGWRRAACAAFTNMIYEDLIKIAYRPERVFTQDLDYEF